LALTSRSLESAQALKAAGDDATLSSQERIARYRAAAQAIFGGAFNLIPQFSLTNAQAVQEAVTFRAAPPAGNLTRHPRANPLIVDEWLQGVTRVQPRAAELETAVIMAEAFGLPQAMQPKPLQLPFRPSDFWIAVEYPET